MEHQPDMDLSQMAQSADRASALMKTLGHRDRLMILCQLAVGEKSVSELQASLGLSQSALSQHLAVLRRERIVSSRKHAQSVSYSLAGDEAPRVMHTLHEVFCKTQGSNDE